MTWHAPSARFAERARGCFLSAPATLMKRPGEVSQTRTRDYYRRLSRTGIDGLAVNAHTGRGPHLGFADRVRLVEQASTLGGITVSGLSESSVVAATAYARAAADAGADALLIFPSELSSRNLSGFLDAVWEAAELPLIAFDLYTGPYDNARFLEALTHPAVAGVKLARLHDAVACQDRIRTVREHGKLAFTGEDRMFGSSLMWGADAALVGIGAAAVDLSLTVFRSYFARDFSTFVRASVVLDEFAATVFAEPIDGYVQRMLWVAVEEGLIEEKSGYDGFAPELPESERLRILSALGRALAVRQRPAHHGIARSA